jgi:cytochrome P450
VHQWSVVHDEKYFHRPDEFIPERWIKDEEASQMGDRLEASQPFSYGPRGCLGKKYVISPSILLRKSVTDHGAHFSAVLRQ